MSDFIIQFPPSRISAASPAQPPPRVDLLTELLSLITEPETMVKIQQAIFNTEKGKATLAFEKWVGNFRLAGGVERKVSSGTSMSFSIQKRNKFRAFGFTTEERIEIERREYILVIINQKPFFVTPEPYSFMFRDGSFIASGQQVSVKEAMLKFYAPLCKVPISEIPRWRNAIHQAIKEQNEPAIISLIKDPTQKISTNICIVDVTEIAGTKSRSLSQ